MDDATRDDYHALLALAGVQTQGLGELLRDCGSPAAVLAASDAQLGAVPPATAQILCNARRQRRAPRAAGRVLRDLARHRLAFVPFHDPAYPAALRQIPDPPPWLFGRGNLACLQAPGVAIVGSRRASHAGLRAAAEAAQQLAAAGYTVCSGLALGIDAAAHRGALRGGSTAAVLASGIDRASPTRHLGLLAEIEARGCVISELPPGTGASRWQFPRRNRIISGLASATIIVEAALPSGSLHTAAAALEQGREVFTLPWSIYHEQGAGCLRLLRDGATPITALGELAGYFPGVRMSRADTENCAGIAPRGGADTVLQLLGDGALSLEQLVQATSRNAQELLALLAELELAGALRCVDGTYLRCDRKSCKP